MVNGVVSRRRTTSRAILLANFSSPYSRRMRVSSWAVAVLSSSAAVRPVVGSIRMSSGASSE